MLVSNLYRIGWFVGLVLIQVLVLNNIHLFGVATPLLYIYLLLKFESGTSRNGMMLWAFLLGFVVDVFSDTMGMNIIASVMLAFCQPTFLMLFVPRDMVDNIVPSAKSMGFLPFFKYVTICVLVHHTTLFMVEFFSFAHLGLLLLRIITSSLLTIACIMAIEGVKKE
ncbi:MAG: rod shape-determining protein MreD [Mediterranea sp.]|jgi:rod shape-determining protein MreD|nr:rod shape-determining protein MreD [Mediterranea sp.]